AHYGLPELFGAPPPGSIVSNPGCYPTAALLALAPLLREGLIEPTGIVVDGKSGVTGAGRQSGDAYSFGAVDENLRAYKPLVHQHTPEMVRALTRIADGVTLTFVPNLLPVKRGLLTTAYARPRAGQGVSAARVAQCLADSYAGSAFVRAMAPYRVMLSGVVGTNDCHVGAAANDDIVVAVGALDNLLKGAAGQAIQNLNLINGWDERAGLGALHRASL
ncbi:MAG: Asd/ArgC dimerization domain-containing protein, partial [Polyangiaceae bacterium]